MQSDSNDKVRKIFKEVTPEVARNVLADFVGKQ
ncbi:unnamed protein product, partial [marine sediment metagenome]